eukprot:TRINITY_DN115_c0_g1_i2.p2 TRINITY_DN115_c0_g1~~TRINITY_DN115_c0_g1_i2.p2  ORF type:complete len:122 (+),score=17.38 TRINITY_DN115_c0_g1_i2:37-402(+)
MCIRDSINAEYGSVCSSEKQVWQRLFGTRCLVCHFLLSCYFWWLRSTRNVRNLGINISFKYSFFFFSGYTSSNFATNTESWQLTGDAVGTFPTYFANDTGYIRGRDARTTAQTWYEVPRQA